MIDIIKTGSSGNSFRFKNIIIDIGISYSLLKKYLNGVTHIFITHEHGDHLNMTTLRKILAFHEEINFICGDWIKKKIIVIANEDRINVVYPNKIYKFGDLKISPFIAYHDTQCYGLRILTKDGHKHFHVTDTSTLQGLSAKDYDTATIECNHHSEEANKIIQMCDSKGEFTHLKGAINSHLSVQEAIKFIKDNNIKKLYPVHIGESTRGFVFDELKKEGLYEE